MRNKKVLVTGGAGFIGSNLVSNLVSSGHSVTVLDNFISGFRSNLEPFPSVRIVEGDVRNRTDIETAICGAEVVFHLAASVGNKRSIDNPFTDAGINVLGTIQVLEAALKEGVKKIVTSSSAGIFGELKHLPIKEDHPTEPDSPYGCTKLCEEKLCLAYSKLYNIEVICLRYFNVYGPNQRFDAYGNVIPIFVFHLLRNEPIEIFGDGEQTRDFVYVDDVVQANLKAAATDGFSGALNIASGKSVTINQLVGLIKQESGVPVEIVYCPERPGDVRHSLADISEASRRIDYLPEINLQSGIRRYIEWARSFNRD